MLVLSVQSIVALAASSCYLGLSDFDFLQWPESPAAQGQTEPFAFSDISEITQTDNGANLDLTFGTNTIVLEGLAGTTLIADDFAFA